MKKPVEFSVNKSLQIEHGSSLEPPLMKAFQY